MRRWRFVEKEGSSSISPLPPVPRRHLPRRSLNPGVCVCPPLTSVPLRPPSLSLSPRSSCFCTLLKALNSLFLTSIVAIRFPLQSISAVFAEKEMGQAFRRAAGKVRSTTIDTTPSTSSTPSRFQNSCDRTPPAVPPDNRVHIHEKNNAQEGSAKSTPEASEERDPSYEAMLNQMVGRISAKPGGELEMGEAFVVQKSKRPLPKVRTTTPDSGRYEERPVAAGTLNVAQLRYIMLMYQGKANDLDGPKDLKEIAQRFRVDAAQLQRIFQFVSLPPEDANKKQQEM